MAWSKGQILARKHVLRAVFALGCQGIVRAFMHHGGVGKMLS